MATEITLCPYCKASLVSDLAKQCFHCGMDWHDPTTVVRRGSPNWNRFGLNADAMYVVELCQQPTGGRYTKYREISHGEHDPNCVLETEAATGAQFINWGFYEYAKHLKLSDGSNFGFEAHGIWMTEAEMKCILGRRREETPPPWVNGIPPMLPPK